MKKIFAVFILLLLSITLISCGTKISNNRTNDSGTAQTDISKIMDEGKTDSGSDNGTNDSGTEQNGTSDTSDVVGTDSGTSDAGTGQTDSSDTTDEGKTDSESDTEDLGTPVTPIENGGNFKKNH